jgi:phytol kinase
VVPLCGVVVRRLLAVGSGVLSDPGLVKSVSRQGDKAELLKGPLYYCLVLLAVTLVFWRENPAGAIAVSMMCGGDGFADIIGRRFGAAQNLKLPWNSSKSWPGSLAMFCAGMAMSAGFFWHFCSMGYFQCYSPVAVLPYLAVVCAACTLVESLPINNWFDDNLSVPLVATVTSLGVLPIAAAASAVIRASGQPMLAMQWLG